MYAVIFEVEPAAGRQQEYLDIAATLRPELEKIDGFISIERFSSLSKPGKILSLSFWRDSQIQVVNNTDERDHQFLHNGRMQIPSGLLWQSSLPSLG